MITFKQEITVPEELVIALAIDLGWRDVIETQSEYKDGEMTQTIMVENPETATQFIDRLSKEHTISFFKPFGDKLVAKKMEELGVIKRLDETKAAIEAQIISPIISGLTTDYTE